jgi:hypothetical protein
MITEKTQNTKHNGKKSNARKVHAYTTGGGSNQSRAGEKRRGYKGIFLL